MGNSKMSKKKLESYQQSNFNYRIQSVIEYLTRPGNLRPRSEKIGVFKTFYPKVGESDLSEDEKKKIVTELVQNKPAVFLQRFGRFLRCLIFNIMIVIIIIIIIVLIINIIIIKLVQN